MRNIINSDTELLLWASPFIIAFIGASLKILKQWASEKEIQPKWVGVLVAVTVLARLPSLLFNRVTNIDEAQTIAHALTLIRSPEPWKSIDFTTNGPLNAYVFFLPKWLGLPIDYLVSHVILLILQIVMCLAIFETVKNWMSRRVALVTMIPLLSFLAFAQGIDFIHQSSELWCVTALSSALALFSRITVDPPVKTWPWWLFIGVLLGMVPFGKPQGAPPALVAALGMYSYILVALNGRKRVGAVGLLTAGGLLFPGIFVGMVFRSDAWNDFFDLYIRANLNYAAAHASGPAIVPSFLWGWGVESGISLFFFIALLFFLIGTVSKRVFSEKEKWVGILLFAITLGGAYAVERAGRPFHHYLLLFMFPGLILLLGWTIQRLKGFRYRGALASFCFFAVTGYLFFANRACYQMIITSFETGRPWQLGLSPVSQSVKHWITGPEDYITVYGYYNEIYVETQLPSATRTVTVYQHSAIWPELYTPYYCRDIVRNRPVVIVDALDTPQDFRQTFVNREEHSFENIPELYRFIRDNYRLVEVIDRSRIYVRTDRLTELSGL